MQLINSLKNLLLNKAINEVGDFICLGRKNNNKFLKNNSIPRLHYKRLNIIAHCFKVLPHLLKLILNLSIFNVIFIDFRVLNLWPIKILYYLNKNNTIICEPDSSGWSSKGYNADRSVHENRKDPNIFFGPKLCANKVIAFSSEWPFLKHPSLKKSKKYIIESSHNRKVWLDYIKNNADVMLKNEHNIEKSNDYCVLLLGYISGEEAKGKKL